MNTQEALGFPFKDAKWVIKLLIGGGLSFVVLICPIVFVQMAVAGTFSKVFSTILFLALLVAYLAPLGYAFQILRDAAQAKEAVLPEWTQWDVLFKDGLMVFAVSLVYGILIGLVSCIISLLTVKVPVLGSIFSLLQVLIGALILIAGPYIAVALAKFSETKNIASAFKFMEILGELKSKCAEYISVSLMVLGVVYVIKVSLGLNLFQHMMQYRSYFMGHASFPLVSLLSPFVMFWLLLVVSRMYGLIYSRKSEGSCCQSQG
ncbi:MAG: DUF4013 domain-containing protein [Chlamydiota bacterium]|nr:DUF4013 domain-containing protein [Chlamydiota bacterium]